METSYEPSPTSSKQEELLYQKVRKCVGDGTAIGRNIRPDFLKNPKTGSNLEIDIALYSFNLAIEYQGAVHFVHIKKYGNNPDKIKERDTIKRNLIRSAKWIDIEFFEEDLSHPDFQSLFISKIETVMKTVGKNNKRYKFFLALLKLLKMKRKPSKPYVVRWYGDNVRMVRITNDEKFTKRLLEKTKKEVIALIDNCVSYKRLYNIKKSLMTVQKT